MVLKAKEIGDPAEINAILRGEPNKEKMDYLNKVAAGVEGYDKAGYIKTFGDPFKRSLTLLDVADEDYDGPLSQAEKDKLEEYRKKYQKQ